VTRPRAITSGSKTKIGKKKRKGEKTSPSASTTKIEKKDESWGIFEFARGPLGPIAGIVQPLANGSVALGVIGFLLLYLIFRGPGRSSSRGVAYPASFSSDRIAAYEELWHREQSELWDWLEERAGLDALLLRDTSGHQDSGRNTKGDKAMAQQREKIRGRKKIAAKLREEKMSDREMEEAIRVTQQRLETLNEVVKKRKSKRNVGAAEKA
jgi:hypothetical protein